MPVSNGLAGPKEQKVLEVNTRQRRDSQLPKMGYSNGGLCAT